MIMRIIITIIILIIIIIIMIITIYVIFMMIILTIIIMMIMIMIIVMILTKMLKTKIMIIILFYTSLFATLRGGVKIISGLLPQGYTLRQAELFGSRLTKNIHTYRSEGLLTFHSCLATRSHFLGLHSVLVLTVNGTVSWKEAIQNCICLVLCLVCRARYPLHERKTK